MAVSFIEGWDLGTNLSGLAQFVHDWNQYWNVNFEYFTYIDGYAEGRAVEIDNNVGTGIIEGLTKGSNVVPNGGEMRLHFWAKLNNTITGSTFRPLIGVCRGGNGDTSWFVEIDGSGNSRLGLGSRLGGGTTSLDGPDNATLTDEWAYYELYVNENTNVLQFYKDNVLVLEATGISTAIDGGGDAELFVGRPDSDQLPVLDHLIVTDGDTVRGVDVPVVAVGASVEGASGAQTDNFGFLGSLVIDDLSYKTGAQSQSLDAGVSDENYAPSTYFLYPENPATNSPWTTAGLANIDAWGLCYNDTQTSRVTNVCLITVVPDPTTGFPIIRNTPPGSAVYISDTWTKTDTNISYGAHLTDIPHSELRSTDEWVSVSDPGCLLFNSETILSTFGITFAEEYRTDYTDWVLVDGVGVNYDSYFVSGYTILGESDKKFQSNYVTVNYEETSVGGAFLQAQWDYSLDGNTGRWSSKQQIYSAQPTGNYKHHSRRLKVRGHGTALQFRITSEDQKDFRINGWAVAASGNQTV